MHAPSLPTRRRRRGATIAAALAVAALALTGCSSGASGSATPASTSEKVTLRFSWWGNDARTAATKQVIDLFQKKHPNITIEPSFTDFSSYWDKLATETAAKDAPDIMQMDEKYLSTYGSQGALADLRDERSKVDVSGISDSSLKTGVVGDALYGAPLAMNSYAVVVNTDLLAKAGVALPDDKTWTWDDLAETARKVSQAGNGEYYGLQAMGFTDADLLNWARQNGEDLFNDKGEVAVSEKTVAGWWTYLKSLTDSGATPSASASIEKQTAGLSSSFAATNKAAFSVWWNNQLTALSSASGSQMKLLQLPTQKGKPGKNAYEKASMYWSVSSRTKHPAEAAQFVDFLLNDKEAANVLLTERGVPSSDAIVKAIEPKLSPTDRAAAEFLNTVEPRLGTAPVPTPPGGANLPTLLMTGTQQVLFDQSTPAEAAKTFVKNLKAALADAR